MAKLCTCSTCSEVTPKGECRRIARECWKRLRVGYMSGDIETMITDVLTDLKHLADRAGLDWSDLEDTAYRHYSAEILGEL